MGTLLVLLVLFVALAVAVKVFVSILVGLVLLPFKILGAVLKVVGALLGVAGRVVGAGLGLVGVLVGGLFALLLLPLLPLILLGGFVWLLVRVMEPRPRVVRMS